MSPDEFDAAVRGWRAQQRHEDWRLGHIAALFLSAQRDEKRRPEPYTASDIFPHLAPPQTETEPVIDEEDCGIDEEELEAELRRMKGLD